MKRWGPLFLVTAAGVLGAALVPYGRRLVAFLPPCPFRQLTGVPCPTCGTTRALLALSQGQLGNAFVHNPLTTGFVVLAGLVAVAWALAHVCGVGLPQAFASLEKHWPWWLRVGVVAAFLANWAWVIAQS